MSEKKRKKTISDWAMMYLCDRRHVFRRGHHYEFCQTHYQRIEDQIMERKVSEFILIHSPRLASANLVRSVVDTIAQMKAKSSEILEPFDVDREASLNVIVFTNGTFNLDSYIQEQLNEQ